MGVEIRHTGLGSTGAPGMRMSVIDRGDSAFQQFMSVGRSVIQRGLVRAGDISNSGHMFLSLEN